MRARYSAPLGLCLSLLAAAVSGAPSTAWAGPATATTADPLTEAKDYYERGRAKFETADYLGAIDLWQQAYGSLKNDDASVEIRAALAYNIAAAREEAYKLSGDILELKRARVLLNRYISEIEALVEAGPERDEMLSGAKERLARIDELIAKDEANAKATPGPKAGGDGDGSSGDGDAGEGPTPETGDPNPVVDGGSGGAGKPLIFAGAGVAALGLAGVGVGAAFLAIGKSKNDEVGELVGPDDEASRVDAITAGERANTIAIGGLVAGGVLLATGGVLIGLGLKKNKSSKVAAVPWMQRNGGGVTLTGRF